MRALAELALGALVTCALGLVAGCAPEACRPGTEYGSCMESRECAEGASCGRLSWPFGTGSICQRECDDELDCEREGGRTPRCLDVGRTGTFRCYAGCATDAHCPDHWVCQPISTGGAACLP